MTDEMNGRVDASNDSDQSAVPAGAPPISGGAPDSVPPHEAALQTERERLAADVGLARPAPNSAPNPVPAATPPHEAPATPQGIEGDIQAILKEVKLPERRAAPEPEAPKKQYDTTLGAMVDAPTPAASDAAAAPAAPPATGQEAAQQPPNPDTLQTVHTLKHDLQHVVRDQKLSVVRAVALEEEKKAHAKELEPTPEVQPKAQHPKNTGVIFAIVLLVLLGAAALGGVYFVAQQQAGTPPAPQIESLVFSEQTVAVSIDNISPIALKGQLAQARQGVGATLGAITRIVPLVASDEAGGGRPATFSEFIAAIGAEPPPELLRALSDDFFFGIHTVDENAPIIVVLVTSYDRAFEAMLRWERAMNAHLSPIFTAVPALVAGQDGIPLERTFSDVVMRNYDVRALKDDVGTIQLFYSFPTRDLLIIAESPYSFTEALTRLQAERRL